MTPIRETIARAISVGHAHGEPDMPWHPQGSNREDALPLWQWFQVDAAAVLRALDEAGLVVVRKEPSEAMVSVITGEAWDAVYEMGRTSERISGGAAHITEADARRLARAVIRAASVVE